MARAWRSVVAGTIVAGVLGGTSFGCSDSSNDPCSGVDCSSRGFCIADQGAGYCACIHGYRPDGQQCLPIDLSNPCYAVECSGHGTCSSDDAGIWCQCDPGYRVLSTTDPRCIEYECDLVCVPVEGTDGGADGDGDGDEGTEHVDVGDAESETGDDGDAGCAPGETRCLGVCADLQTSIDHCGGCGQACRPDNAAGTCLAGTCVLVCTDGWVDENGVPWDGCEYACAGTAGSEVPGTTCADGQDNDCDGRTDAGDRDCASCVPEFCNSNDDDCDGLTDEDFDLDFDPMHCGTCDTWCPPRPDASPTCELGSCGFVCTAGRADANGDPADGCEAPCTAAPTPDETVCNDRDDDCDGRVDEDWTGTATCGAGLCFRTEACVGGEVACRPGRPPTATDPSCDGIDDDCDAATDEDGTCECTAPGDCADGDPCTQDLCETLVCRNPPAADGTTCDTGACCGGACVDTDVARDHCGSCTVVCPDDLNADGVCAAGTCGLACRGGYYDLDGAPGCEYECLVSPTTESCNGADDDCDGEVDEGCPCPFGQSRPCGTDEGECTAGTERCLATGWTPCEGEIGAATEACNGLDDDCDVDTDEGFPLGDPCDGADLDLCEEGLTVCGGGVAICSDTTGNNAETCNGLDDDCDTVVDEGCPCVVGSTQDCGTDEGVCSRGTQTCLGIAWGPCVGGVEPGTETCNGQDDDCDAATDEGFGVGDACDGTDGDLCAEGVFVCAAPDHTSCNDATGTIVELCNGVDDDCDGTTDESCEACQPSGWFLEVVDALDDKGQYASVAADSAGGLYAAYYDASGNDLEFAEHAPDGWWAPAAVDSTGTVGQYASLVVDSSGVLHAAYYDASNTALRYARRAPGAGWEFATPDATGTVGQYASIAVDATGGVHIAYYDATNTALKYAHRPASGAWTVVTVDNAASVGSWAAVAIDRTDNLHIAYRDATALTLKYATKPVGGTVWSSRTVDTSANVGQYTSLAVDAAGTVHVFHYDATTDDLRHAWGTSAGAWSSEIVDSAGNVGQYTSIRIGPTGTLYVAYQDATNTNLKLASKPTGAPTWTTALVDGTGDMGSYASLGVDAADGVHISHRDNGNDNLRYAFRPAGGSWTLTTVAAQGNVGQYTSLALDPVSGVHVAYYDATGGNLFVACRGPGGLWTQQTIESAGNVGPWTSIARDSTGGLHVAYRDATNSALKYARHPPGGVWESVTVDNTGNMGEYTSIGLDGADGVHIAYRDETNTALKYAYRAAGGTAWTFATPDNTANVGEYTALAVESSGRVHIAYYNTSSDDLVYVTRGPSPSDPWSSPEAVDTSGSVGQWASAVVDAAGQVHVVYYAVTATEPRYAVRSATGLWRTETIDTGSARGEYVSLALDSTGGVHTAYTHAVSYDINGDTIPDVSYPELWYAYRSPASGTWTRRAIDTSQNVGQYAAVAVDADDRPHILYYDNANNDLLHAWRAP